MNLNSTSEFTAMRVNKAAERMQQSGHLNRKIIQLSGFNKIEKMSLRRMIESLGAQFYPEPKFDARCNLVVLKRPVRSEKFLCGLAKGIPIVNPQYIEDSFALNHWVDAQKYIWNASNTSDECPEYMLKAPIKAMERVRATGKKAFYNWTCAVKVQDENSAIIYKRILSTGGARIIDIKLESVTCNKNVPAGLTHLFTEILYRGSYLQTIAKNSVHCLIADYIGDFLIKDEQPQGHHYIVPYCHIIVISDSPSHSESSPTVISEHQNITDTDSDIEIISLVTSHRKTPVRKSLKFKATSNVSPITRTVSTISSVSTVSACLPQQRHQNLSAVSTVSAPDLKAATKYHDMELIGATATHDTHTHLTFSSSVNGSLLAAEDSFRMNQEKHKLSSKESNFTPKKQKTSTLKTDLVEEVSPQSDTVVSSPTLIRVKPLSPSQASTMKEYVNKWLPTSPSRSLLHLATDSSQSNLTVSSQSGLTVSSQSGLTVSSQSGLTVSSQSSLTASSHSNLTRPILSQSNLATSSQSLLTSPKTGTVSVYSSDDTHSSRRPNASYEQTKYSNIPSQSKTFSQSPSQKQDTSQSHRKYTKLLVLTPNKLTQSVSRSSQSSSTWITPVKLSPQSPPPCSQSQNTPDKVKSEPLTLKSPSSSCSKLASHGKTKRKPVMPHGSLLKYFPLAPNNGALNSDSSTINIQKTTENIAIKLEEDNLFFVDMLPLKYKQSNQKEIHNSQIEVTTIRDETSNVQRGALNKQLTLDSSIEKDAAAAAAKSNLNNNIKPQVLSGASKNLASDAALGLSNETHRPNTSARNLIYNKHQQLVQIHNTPAEEFVDLTDEFHCRELQKIPVLLIKQVEAYFDSSYNEQIMEGVEMLDACTSNVHYPPSSLIKPLYHLLLNTADVPIANTIYKYLMKILQVNPPNRRIYEDEQASPSKRFRALRMRHIYMLSLFERPEYRASYFTQLNTAVQAIIDGVLPAKQESQTNEFSDDEEDEENEDEDMEEEQKEGGVDPTFHLTNSDVKMDSTGHYNGSIGCRLFIDYLSKLLIEDYQTAKTQKDSMLYEICKGGPFRVHLADSKDAASLLDLAKRLVDSKEYELGLKLIQLIGLLADMCHPIANDVTNYSTTILLNHFSNIITNSSAERAEDILAGVSLPTWFAYRVILHILDNPSDYNPQLIRNPISMAVPSLRALISNYFFLVPNDKHESLLTVNGHDASAKRHLSSLPSKSKRNPKGETPLHIACIKGDTEVARQLLMDPYTDVNAVDNNGWTPLHEACNHEHLDIVEMLLKHRSPHFHADGRGLVNMLAAGGEDSLTPLHDAVIVGSSDIVKLLLMHGGKKLVLAQSNKGTPLDIANNAEIEKLLRDTLESSEHAEKGRGSCSKHHLQVVCPDPEVYRTQTCSTSKPAVERYVFYCVTALTLHLREFPLTSTDNIIIDRMRSHLQPFLEHIEWLNSDSQMRDQANDRLMCLLLLSL